jgi:hypothetical protein
MQMAVTKRLLITQLLLFNEMPDSGIAQTPFPGRNFHVLSLQECLQGETLRICGSLSDGNAAATVFGAPTLLIAYHTDGLQRYNILRRIRKAVPWQRQMLQAPRPFVD